jgi:hypothetical protein
LQLALSLLPRSNGGCRAAAEARLLGKGERDWARPARRSGLLPAQLLGALAPRTLCPLVFARPCTMKLLRNLAVVRTPLRVLVYSLRA